MAAIQRLVPTIRKGLEKHHTTIDDTIVHDAKLADFGYEQELKRSYSLLGMIGFAFSIVTSWSALAGVLLIGIPAGGPPVMVWSWLGVCVISLLVAYSFAEMCSAYPVAGGQYSWTAILAPPKYARALAWMCGWFMNTGLISMGAAGNWIFATFVLGLANLNHPSYVIQRWHVVLLCYLTAIFCATVNIFLSKFFNRISTGVLCWNILSFFVVIITMLATQDQKQPASFVFVEFRNDTGFSSPGMAVMIGLLQSLFGMCCYDAPAKMVEEMRSPQTEAPKAIIASVYIGAVTGFVFLIAAFFCVGDYATAGSTSTGVPLIQIFLDSTQSVSGASVLAAMVATTCLCGSNSLMAEGSRGLWAFSRDHGLPFSRFFSRITKESAIPVNTILLYTGVAMALNSLYFISYTGFSTVISISTFGFYLSYAVPLGARLWTYFSTGQSRVLPGPYSLGKYGIYFNIAALVFLLFSCVAMNFPQVGPVDSLNMNYCSAAFGVIGLISAVTWMLDGRKNFTGPQMVSSVSVGADTKRNSGTIYNGGTPVTEEKGHARGVSGVNEFKHAESGRSTSESSMSVE